MPRRRSVSSRHSASQRLRVALLIDSGDTWGRGIIRGISAAVRQVLPWDLLVAPRDDEWRLRVPRGWKGDGVIAAIRDDRTAAHVGALRVPMVNVSSWGQARRGWFRVMTDDRRRAEMAFAHFRERGFRHFGYYGPPSSRYSDDRGTQFHDVVTAAGFACAMFQIPAGRRGWQGVQQHTLEWLRKTPRPLAVLAADPHPAVQLTEICRAAGFRVPEEIAILAGDTDNLLCDVSDPPLSSILLASEQIGAASVAMLETLLRGDKPPVAAVEIPPLRVVARQSSDMLAIDDAQVVDALRLIRERAHTGLQVGDVLQAVPISRRSLEQRFRQLLNRSPADEIRRVKLDRVKRLLTSTEQTMEQIAAACGFATASQLCFAFKREMQQTPIDYRRRSRILAEPR